MNLKGIVGSVGGYEVGSGEWRFACWGAVMLHLLTGSRNREAGCISEHAVLRGGGGGGGANWPTGKG